MSVSTDIDIDVANRDEVLSKIFHVDAAIMASGSSRKHNSGVYYQNIPYDPFTNLSTIDYKEADNYGYFKIDMLNNHVYENIDDEDHLIALMNKEPNWSLFEELSVVEQLFHISNYYPLVKKLKPKSVIDLAMILAIIRPSKYYLQDTNWHIIRNRVWESEGKDQYVFKKSHAISYAIVIVIQLNRLCEQGLVSI